MVAFHTHFSHFCIYKNGKVGGPSGGGRGSTRKETQGAKLMPKLVKINAQGRRVGEDHPRAVLSDHEVDLLWGFLEDRDALIARMRAAGAAQVQIEATLTQAGLSYRLLAAKFEVHKQTVAKVAQGARRSQTVVKRKPYP